MRFQSIDRLNYNWFGHEYCGENELYERWYYPNDNRYQYIIYTTYCRVENQCTPQVESEVEFVYNTNKSLRERIILWSPDLEYGSYWASSYFYNYNSNGFIREIDYYPYYTRDSLKSDLSAKIYLNYNKKFLLSKSIAYSFSHNGKDSTIAEKDTFEYNENDLLIENIGYYWDTTSGWIKNYKRIMSYDTNNSLSDSIIFIWNIKSNIWIENEKFIFCSSKHIINSLNEENIKPDLFIYPSPVKDNLYIETGTKYSKLVISGLDGKMIRNLNFRSTSSVINLEQLPPGMYILRIFDDKSIITRKFLKE
jgi:hypothetical protein